MTKWLTLLLCLLLLPLCAKADAPETIFSVQGGQTGETGTAFRGEQDYCGDGKYMLTVAEDTPVYRLPGDEEIGMVHAGTRMIACGGDSAEQGIIWCRAYSRETGYCYLPGGTVLLKDKPQELTYQPGFGQTVGLFKVDDPDKYTVEVVREVEAECILAQLLGVTAHRQEDGKYLLVGHFSLEENVCQVTREASIATLYDLDGQPVEVMTFVFDLPKWY